MPIQETSYPCFVVSCDQCGAKTWPPSTSRAGAWDIARRDHHYVKRGKRYLCEGCATTIVPGDLGSLFPRDVL